MGQNMAQTKASPSCRQEKTQLLSLRGLSPLLAPEAPCLGPGSSCESVKGSQETQGSRKTLN